MWNQMKTILLLGTLSAFVTGVVSLLAPGYWVPFGAVAVGLNLMMYYYSDRLVLRMHKATELNGADHPALHRMLRVRSIRPKLGQRQVEHGRMTSGRDLQIAFGWSTQRGPIASHQVRP